MLFFLMRPLMVARISRSTPSTLTLNCVLGNTSSMMPSILITSSLPMTLVSCLSPHLTYGNSLFVTENGHHVALVHGANSLDLGAGIGIVLDLDTGLTGASPKVPPTSCSLG